MENQQTSSTPQVIPQSIPPVAQMPTTAQMPSTKKSFKELLSGLRDKYKTLPKNMKLLVIMGGVFAVSLLLLLVAAVAKKGNTANIVATPTPIASPTSSSPIPQYVITNPSRYATDSGILKIEGDVDSLSKDMDAADLRSSDLRVPELDMNVKF